MAVISAVILIRGHSGVGMLVVLIGTCLIKIVGTVPERRQHCASPDRAPKRALSVKCETLTWWQQG